MKRQGLAAPLLAAAASVWMLAAGTGCRPTGRVPANAALQPGAFKGSNILLVSIDTLRADRVGAYSGRHLTPTIDRLAASGVRFSRAYAHAPMTLPAHASIMTGLFPLHHGIHINGAAALDARAPTLAELLRRAGYRTGAFIGSFVLDARFGLNRGFDVYDDRVGTERGPITFGFVERPAAQVARAASEWILRAPTGAPAVPWFAWLHFFDPHAPYRAPKRIVDDPYDNEVAYTDAELGAFLETLRGAGLLDRTLVIVLADHGESLGDHGEETHGLFAYDSTLRIPLIVSGPGLRPSTVEDLAAQADLLPTIADLVGAEAPPSLDGRSLVPAMRGGAGRADDRAIYFEALDANLTRHWAPLVGVVAGTWKYIALPIAELYDLARDPQEATNLAERERSRKTALDRLLNQLSAGSPSAIAREVDPDAAARLRALGYTALTAAPPGDRRYGPDDDPKRLVDVDRRYQSALQLVGEHRHPEAIALFREVIDRRPDFTAAYLTLASVLIEDRRPREAVDAIIEARRRGLTDPKLFERLGAAYLAAGDRGQAARVLEPLVAGSDASVDALNALAIVHAEAGQRDRARALFRRALDKAPSAASIWNNLGLLELSDHRAADAARAFQRSVQSDPGFAPGWIGLGASQAAAYPAAAIDAWTRAVALVPQEYDTLYNLGMLLWQSGRRTEAIPVLDRFTREAPPTRYAADIARVRDLLSKQP